MKVSNILNISPPWVIVVTVVHTVFCLRAFCCFYPLPPYSTLPRRPAYNYVRLVFIIYIALRALIVFLEIPSQYAIIAKVLVRKYNQ